MAKRTTKAQTVLWEAESHLRVARTNLANAEAAVGEARAVVAALQKSYDYLSLALAPKSRKTPVKKKDEPLLKDVSKDRLCQFEGCGQPEDGADHSEPSPNFHKFQGKKSKVAAG